MNTAEYDEDDRRRGGFFFALLGGVLLLLLGLFGGWLAFGDSTPKALGSRPSASPSPDIAVVLPPGAPVSRPSVSPSPQVVVGTGQAQPATQPGNGNDGNGNGNGGTNPGHALTVSGQVTGTVGPGSPAALVITIANPRATIVETNSSS